MIWIVNLKTLLEHPLFTTVAVVVFILCAIIAYNKSINSRKYYKCPECGESFRSEHMTSKSCKVCGAQLEETNDTNVNDKAV